MRGLVLGLVLVLALLLSRGSSSQGVPTAVPTPGPTPKPSARPSSRPTARPSPLPTFAPTPVPTPRPSLPNSRNFWNNDVIKLTLDGRSVLRDDGPTVLKFTAFTNGPIYANDGGHFRVVLQVKDVVGMSDCIRIGENMLKVKDQVSSMVLFSNSSFIKSAVPLSKVFNVAVQKLQNARSSVDWTTTYKFTFQRTDFGNQYFQSSVFTGKQVWAHLNTTGCAKPRTIGHWNDPSRWSLGVVPNTIQKVVFTSGVGVTMMPPTTVTISTLKMSDGLLLAHNSTCPPGWTPNPTGLTSSKCYKLFDKEELSFDDAESACQNSYGSMDAHLVQISDLAEQGLVRRMCRGPIGSNAYVRGCWIGLKDKLGVGKYNWLEPKTVRNNTFRDWRRYEPSNHTFSEGTSTNGELCVFHVPWQVDPLIVEQGSWNDFSCTLKKSYVCQMFATTRRSVLIVINSTLSGGGIEGGLLRLQGTAEISNFFATRTATIILSDVSKSANIISNVNLEDGSALIVSASVVSTPPPTDNVKAVNGSYIGEPASATGMLPTVTVSSSVSWSITQSIIINAETEISGRVQIGKGNKVQLLRGGQLSHATFVLDDTSSSILLGGSSKMSTYDAFEIKSSHRAPVIGEYTNDYTEDSKPIGVYRIKIGSDISRNCIGYHASAEDMAVELNTMPSVLDRGGVTVRRYGDGTDPSFSFGYTYRIEMDAPPTNAFDLGPLNMTISCYGIGACRCAETKVPLVDETGMSMCLRKEGNSSRVDAQACVVPPILVATRITSLSFMQSTTKVGTGSLVISDGTHRLPPRSGITISSALIGTGIVGANVINWGGIAVDGFGSIIVTGSGWLGWDAATSLWSPEWTEYRGKVGLLERSPAFKMLVTLFSISGMGRVLTASPNSNMTWVQGSWNGGIIGGRARLSISKQLVADKGAPNTRTNPSGNKALRYAMTLFVQKTALFLWNSGNISLSNGAQFIVEGNFTAHTVGDVTQHMGMANLLSAPDSQGLALLQIEPTLNWHGYYGAELPLELRGGTYPNPLCGKFCDRTPILLFRSGLLTLDDRSNSSFSLPVNMLGYTNKKIGVSAYVKMASGGICGNNVEVTIQSGTYYVFSGGQMAMRRTCKIKGQGELLITGGRHNMGSQIDSHITIAGGALVWPITNPPGDTISFNGGLLISNTGSLQVEPFKTQINVLNDVVFQDDSLLQFPMIGTAAQAANSDSEDAPDSSPRGSLRAKGVMRWNGGTLRGKADFIAENELYVSGGVKQIRSLAKLVNQGHGEWDSGDIVMGDGGDFLNLGTMQMARGSGSFVSNDYYQGTVTPIESGGDVFAKDFHSYDLDQGYLRYDQYILLRTQFVSQAPDGWTAAQQSKKIDSPFNIV